MNIAIVPFSTMIDQDQRGTINYFTINIYSTLPRIIGGGFCNYIHSYRIMMLWYGFDADMF